MNLAGRLVRVALAALLALLILVVGGVGLVLLAFDANQYKSALAGAVRERFHRTLELPGRIELRLLPPFTLDTGPMRLSEPGSDAQFAQAADMRLHLDPLALLQRRIVIDRIDLDAPRLVVVRDARGRFNFDDLLAQLGATDASGAMSAVSLQVRTLRVAGGDLLLRDLGNDVEGRLSALDVSLDGLGLPGQQPMLLRARAAFARPALDAGIELRGLLHVAAGTPLRCQDFQLRAEGSMAGSKRLLANVGGTLSYTPEDGGALSLSALQIRAKGQDGASRPLQVDLALPRLDWRGDHVTVGALDARVLLGATPRTTRLVLSAPAASGPTRALRWPRATLQLQRGALQAQLDGAPVLDGGGRSVQVGDARLQGSWHADHAAPVTFDLQGQLGATLTSASMRLDGRAADAAVRLTGASDGTTLSLQAGFSRLDLDALRAAGLDVASLAGQRDLAVDAQVQADALRLTGTSWTRAQAQLRSGDGSLRIDHLAAQGFGGSLSGNARLDGATSALTAQLAAKDVHARAMLPALGLPALAHGIGELHADLRTQGTDRAARLHALQGDVSLTLRDGGLDGVDLGALLHAPDNAAPVPLDPARSTPLRRLAATLRVADGVMSTTDLALESSTLRATGRGRIDLPARSAELELRVAPKRGPARTVRIAGGFDALHATPAGSGTGGATRRR